MRPARTGSARAALAVLASASLLLTAGCAARFDRPPAGSQEALNQGDGLTPEEGGLPTGGTTTGTTGFGTTGGSGAIGTTGGTTGVAGTTGGTGGTTGAQGSTGGTTGAGTTGGSVPAGSKTGINGSTITVGLFVPLTGAAPVPPTVRQQVQTYFTYVQDHGGIWGRNVTVKVYDTKSTEAGARSAVTNAQGSIFAAVSLDRLTVAGALVSALHQAHIPHLVTQVPPSLKLPDDAWVTGAEQRQQGIQIADYMAHVLKVKKVGIVTETDPGLYAGRDAFKAEAGALGLQVVHSEAVDPNANQYLSEAQKLKNDGAQAVWLYMAPTVAINISKEDQSIGYHPTWVGNSISWGFNLALTPASGALQGARAFSPWGGLSDPRYKVFNQVDTANAAGTQDKDIGLAAWGFGQIVARALKDVGRDLGRNSFTYAMQHLRIGTTDTVTGVPMCWSPLDFTGGKKFGSANRSIVMRVTGSGNGVWSTESDYRSRF